MQKYLFISKSYRDLIILLGDIMQCNFLNKTGTGDTETYRCEIKPCNFEPTDEDKSKYCIGENFPCCPRFKMIKSFNLNE